LNGEINIEEEIDTEKIIRFSIFPAKRDLVKETMPLNKGSSFSLSVEQPQHPLKRKQPLSLDESVPEKSEDNLSTKDLTKNRLFRSNDILIQVSLETLLDMLKAYAGIKDCGEETQTHLNMVTNLLLLC
jgi:methyltransferase-like protein